MALSGLFVVLALGFVLGMRHAADPDHVIAVTTIVTRHRTLRAAVWIGGAWGLGHTLTILVVGGGITLFGWVIPQRLGLSFEFGVAIMLIILGLATLKRPVIHLIREWRHRLPVNPRGIVHAQVHSHGDYVHAHPHGDDLEHHPHRPDQTPLAWFDRHLGSIGLFQLLRPLVVGIVHGLAGSASVALLVLATISEARWAVVYLVLFGGGTILGMALITAALTWPLAAGNRASLLAGKLRIASGLASLGFGVFLAYQVGVTQGLLLGYM